MRQAVHLGDLVERLGRLERLEVRCQRCRRHGRVQLATLIAEHGPDMGLPDLAVRLAADCPRTKAANVAERCFVTFPQLLDLPAAK